MKPAQSQGKHGETKYGKSLLSVLFILWFAGYVPGSFVEISRAADLQNSGWTIQGQQASETAQPAVQAQEQPEQLADIQEEEPTFFDPESLPDSVPEADWVFEIPVRVSEISQQVEKIGLVCEVFTGDKYMEELHGENNWKNKTVYGRAKKRIELHNGSFEGTVMVGVNKTGKYWKATHYTCWMYVIGPDNHWHVPSIKPKNPLYRRMHSGHPFRWETRGVPLPQWAKFARPENGP